MSLPIGTCGHDMAPSDDSQTAGAGCGSRIACPAGRPLVCSSYIPLLTRLGSMLDVSGDDICLEERIAQRLCRGVRRLLWTQRYASITEFPLANGRRADIFGVTDGSDIVIVEVKSSIVDFRTDQKWPEYRAYCDAFY